MPRDSKINEHKASLCLQFILISIFVPILYPPYRATDRSQTKKSNFAGFLETKSQKNRTISREFRGNFRGKLGRKAIGTKWQILWLFSGKILLEIDRLIALIRPAFLMFF